MSSLVQCRRYPSTSTLSRQAAASKPAQVRNSRGCSPRIAGQRRHESTDNKAASAETEAKSADEVIRETKEALAKLKASRGASRAQAIEEAYQAAKQRTAEEPAVNWTRLRTPLLFGAGLYLGLVLFGNHRDEQTGSDFLAELKASFEGGPSKKKQHGDGASRDEDYDGNDGRPEVETSGNNNKSGITSEYEKWKASREGGRD